MSEQRSKVVRILVAAGGQKVDEAAMMLACRMASRHRADEESGPAEVYAVHVIEVNRSLPLSAPVETDVSRGEEVLDNLEQLAAEFEIKVQAELVQARDTGPAILGEAEEWGASTIVMGLPYKRRFGEFNLGKTVPYVLKNASCRVILLREKLEGA